MAAEPKTSNCSGSFTLLPCTDKSMDECNSYVDEYLATGTLPGLNKKAQDASNKYADAGTSYEKATNELKSLKDQSEQLITDMKTCANDKVAHPNGAADPACVALQNQYKEVQNDIVDAQAALEDATDNLNGAKNASNAADENAGSLNGNRDDLLACAVKTGRMDLALVPYYITYMINFALGLIGLISVLFIVIGGYRYVIGGLGEDKEKGKKTISHALMGMGVALLAWSLVNIILKAITG